MSNEAQTTDKSTWVIDASHSVVQFKVKHLMITTVTGTFGKFEGNISVNGTDLSTATATFKADVDSISTGDAQRDGHIHSADFFDTANHPTLAFESTSFEKGSDENTWKMHGNLDFHGVNHPVTFDVEYNGAANDPWGNAKAAYTIEGKISRKEWGLVWNVGLETGGWLVSDEVKIHAEIQVLKQA